MSGSGGQVLPDWHMPGLQFVKVYQLQEFSVATLLPFFNRYGPQLSGLHFRTAGRVSSLPSILSRTTTLQSLVICETDLRVLRLIDGQSFPSITHLGLQPPTLEDKPDLYNIEATSGYFASLLENRVFPGLKSMRVFGIKDQLSLETDWGKLSGLCRSQNLVLGAGENY